VRRFPRYGKKRKEKRVRTGKEEVGKKKMVGEKGEYVGGDKVEGR